MRLDLDQVARRFEIGDQLPSRLITIQAAVVTTILVDRGVLVHDVDELEVVTLAHLVVVGIVCWRDLHGTGAECALHVRIGDHFDASPDRRQQNIAPDERLIAFVVGMHRHGGIAQQRFGARRRDRDRRCISVIADAPIVVIASRPYSGYTTAIPGAPRDRPRYPRSRCYSADTS